MKIANICALAMCALMIILGIAVLFASGPIVIKLIWSCVSIFAGVALGSIGIELWKMCKEDE